MVALGVLGPLELRGADGAVVALGSVQRRLLAALAMRPNVAVADDVLAELTWGARLPADPVATVHTNIARLRRTLPSTLRIVTEPRAYRLAIEATELDVLRFTAHVQSAHERTGEDRLRLLDAALALWRGTPFAELDHSSTSATVGRLTEARVAADESRAETLLAMGRAGEAIGDLEAVVAQEPTRESAVALLVRALCAVGRQSDALRVFSRLRRSLVEELGIAPSEPLRHLESQVLRQELPAATVPGPVLPRIRPLPPSSFVGRDDDLQRVADLLAARRFVAIVGPGGVGKTRLARHAAAAAREGHPDGVIWIELSSLVDAADVPAAIANELRLTVAPGEPLLDQLAEALAGRRVLVVLDNGEHLADGLVTVVERIAGVATVDVLVTSRVPLRAEDEHVVVLAPLAGHDAVRLFLDRLAAVAVPALVARADTDVVTEIVGRLDGLPLVLELAAARVPGLGLRGLRDALDEPFGVLSGGHGPGHHRSLLEVVEWSVRLLTDAQRELFVDMAAFVGPVELSAVAAVAQGDGPVTGTLADLVDRSLVTRHDADPATYGMFEFLRAYGRGHLTSDRRAAAAAERHARWAVRFAEALLAADTTPEQGVARRRFDVHLADLRVAHAWLRDNERTDDLIRLTIVLAHHGYYRLLVDLVGLVGETIRSLAHVDDPRRVRLLGLAANFGWQRGDLAQAERYSKEAVDLADALGVAHLTAAAHGALGTVLMMRGDRDGSRTECDEARRLAAADGDHYTEALALTDLGLAAGYAGDDVVAARYGDALEALAAAVGAPSIRGWAAYLHGERLAERDPMAATRHLTDAIAAAEEVDERFLAGVARHTLMTTAARLDEAGHAVTSFAGLLDQWNGSGAWTQLWLTMRALIEALSRDGRHHEAAVLLGAHATSCTASAVFGADARRLDDAAAAARRNLGERFDDSWAEGAALGEQRAITLAIALTRPAEGPDAAPPGAPPG